ncbi:MAG: glutaminyl-peptide cyclotransferase [Flavobacteriales bacterium]|nr:glutaminyl-peptide cyclotransferase [Flavobacteriales bacterium]MCB9448270.1 glutaminyl-peptide cyclotransferase [Flavobacteriales bacterium]
MPPIPYFRVYRYLLVLGCAIMVWQGCRNDGSSQGTNTSAPPETPPVPNIAFNVVKSYPHDKQAFTEGFLFHKGKLFESTGATKGLPQTRSLFGEVNMETGVIDTKVEIDKKRYFGEGITFLNGKVYQLTYQSGVGFVYEDSTYRKLSEFMIPSPEGWGLTTDGHHLVMSDGTDVITYLNPADWKVVRRLKVTERGYAKDYLNELEFVNGMLYANVWRTNEIVRIDPATGKVTGKMDLTRLAEETREQYSGCQEMNGIAYDTTTSMLYVTGKMWPRIYALTLEE